MTQTSHKPSGKLAEIFSKINMSELPAMSGHVAELIGLSTSSRSAAYDLSKVILKDYSLTNKVLQVVNSAYYALRKPVSSISKAVTVLGFDAVRDLAVGIALFEDFVKSGVEKKSISKLMTQSFLSALQARDIAIAKNMNVLPEEAFICALLCNLGRIIVCIYLPDVYSKIENKIDNGLSEERAAKSMLDDLTYHAIGREVAIFWNLADKIITSMKTDPAKPKNSYDSEGYLGNLSSFSNAYVDAVCRGRDVGPLMEKYGKIISLDDKETFEMFKKNVESAQDISDSMRYGLAKLDIQDRLEEIEHPEKKKRSGGRAKKNGTPQGPVVDELDDLPSSDKSINDYIRDLTVTLMGSFKIDLFYKDLLEALYCGVGFDRVILAIMKIQATKISVVGRYGLGDIKPNDIAYFDHPLTNSEFAVVRCLKLCKDMVIPPNTPGTFPKEFQYLVKDRAVYLFPICINKRAIALIYLDRKLGRPKLNKEQVKSSRLFRDFAVMAIQKLREKK